MFADEFRTLIIGKTEFEATSQHNVIYKALTHARMVAAGLVDPAPTDYGTNAPADGNEPDFPRPKTGVNPSELERFDPDKPRSFSLDEFVNHIHYLQATKVVSGKLTAVSATNFAKSFKSVVDKLAVLRRDPRIKFMMKNWQDGDPLPCIGRSFSLR